MGAIAMGRRRVLGLHGAGGGEVDLCWEWRGNFVRVFEGMKLRGRVGVPRDLPAEEAGDYFINGRYGDLERAAQAAIGEHPDWGEIAFVGESDEWSVRPCDANESPLLEEEEWDDWMSPVRPRRRITGELAWGDDWGTEAWLRGADGGE